MKLRAVLDLIAARPLLRRKDLIQRYGIDEKTLWRWRKRGVLPAPIYMPGCNIPLWRPCDIEEFELSRRK
jgi:predicted DNA-binding transcriptional regulator AlpA